jgi:pimeloyl-ACP methyl ester carboxylesterase
MSQKPALVRASDIHGVSRLAVDAVVGLTRLVETLHHNISRAPGVIATPTRAPMGGITGFVYRTIRSVTRLVGGGVDAVLSQLVPLLHEEPSSAAREAVLAALNGVLGDHLTATANPLVISMQLRRHGVALELDSRALAAAIPQRSGRIAVLIHGLCLGDLQWRRKDHDHGASLEAEAGFTAVYLRYNTGLHVSANGRQCAALLEEMVDAWPVPVQELAIVGHSMGGLVARSACHYGEVAGHRWPRRLRSLVFLGTPHHGAPLERGGHWIDVALDSSPYTAAFTRLGRIRSAGITDLRYGNLLDEDWRGRDRFGRSKDERVALPLPEGVCCFAAAASLSAAPGRRPLGDGLVTVASALGKHRSPARTLAIPDANQWIGYGMGHLDLLDRVEVYEQLRRWLAPAD